MNRVTRQDATLAVIGGGQAAKVLLSRIAETAAQGDGSWEGASVLVFERGAEFGTGLAWSRRNVLPEHMTSLASPETRADFGDRQSRQMRGLVRLLDEFGVTVHLIGGTEIVDLRPGGGAWALCAAGGPICRAQAVVLATGHWDRGEGQSPWPAPALQRKHAATTDGRVLIKGSGLSAVDSAITLGLGAGWFEPGRAGRLRYVAQAPLDITMLSPSGCLPAVWGATPPVLSDLQNALDARLRSSWRRDGALRLEAALDHLADLAADAGLETAGSGFAPRRPLRDRLSEIARLERARARYPWRTLRHDLALVCGDHRQASPLVRQLPMQAFLLATIPILSEAFHGLSMADRRLFKRTIRGPLYRHAMPMVRQSACFIDALFAAGVLHVGTLWRGPGAPPGPDLIINATGQDEDMTKNHHPLWRALTAQGLIGAGQDRARPAQAPCLRIDPATRRLREAKLPLFAMGPITVGTFMDAQSIGHLMRDAMAIVDDLATALVRSRDQTGAVAP